MPLHLRHTLHALHLELLCNMLVLHSHWSTIHVWGNLLGLLIEWHLHVAVHVHMLLVTLWIWHLLTVWHAHMI